MAINTKIFATLFLAVFATTLGAGIVAPLLPVYAHELGAGGFQIGLIFGAFSLTRSIFVPYFGKLSDWKGRKPFLTSGLFIYFLLSMIFIVSKDVGVLILLRLGQGFASAMILPVAQAYIGMITPINKEGSIMGLFNVSLYAGLSTGPLLGGFVKDWSNIRVSFLSMGALTFFGFLLCLLLLPPESGPRQENRAGASTSTPYLDLMKTPSVRSLFIFRMCFTTCVGIVWAFLPLFASTRLGLSSSAIGIVVMLIVLVAALFQVPMGYIADRVNKKFLVTAGGIIGVVSTLLLNAACSFSELAFAGGLLGLAGGISVPAVMALGVIHGRQSKAMGSLMGLLAMAHSLGMFVGPLVAGILIDLFDFETIFILGTFVLAIGTIIFLRSR
jgi:DHA1 family multidrug resistance protein-like MFS transporter